MENKPNKKGLKLDPVAIGGAILIILGILWTVDQFSTEQLYFSWFPVLMLIAGLLMILRLLKDKK